MSTNNIYVTEIKRKPVLKYTLNKCHVHWLSSFKGNFGYCQRASFLRRETGKVVWIPSFDDFRICINTGFRYVYVLLMFPRMIFWTKK